MTKKSTTSTKTVATKAKSATRSKSGEPSAKTRILLAIASELALGKDEADKQRVFSLTGMTNKHTFDTNCSSMKKKGLIQDGEQSGSKALKLTKKGLEEVGPEAVARPKNNDAAQEKLKAQIKNKKAHEIFDILVDGRAYSRDELAKKLGVEKNKTFSTYVSYLSKVVDKEGNKLKLKDVAFPCGRSCDA